MFSARSGPGGLGFAVVALTTSGPLSLFAITAFAILFAVNSALKHSEKGEGAKAAEAAVSDGWRGMGRGRNRGHGFARGCKSGVQMRSGRSSASVVILGFLAFVFAGFAQR